MPESKTTCNPQAGAQFDLVEIFEETRKDFNRIDKDNSGYLDRFEVSQWAANGPTDKARKAGDYLTTNFNCVRETTLRVAMQEEKLKVTGLNPYEVRDAKGIMLKHIETLGMVADKDKVGAAVRDSVASERKEDLEKGIFYTGAGALVLAIGGSLCVSAILCVVPGTGVLLGGAYMTGRGIERLVDLRTASRRGKEYEVEMETRRKMLQSSKVQ